MQENNFEKAVQQKLDALHLTPSEPVWQKIEASIRKKRERRLVLWMLPLLLLTAGLAWWGLTTTPSEKTVAKKAPETVEPAQTFSKPHVGTTDKKAHTVSDLVTVQTQSDNDTPIENKHAKIEKGDTPKSAVDRKYGDSKNGIASNNFLSKPLNPITPESGKNIVENTIAITPARFTNHVAAGNTYPGLALKVSDTAPAINAAANRIVIDKKELPKISKPAVQANNKAWQWYVTSRAGASNISDGTEFFSLTTNKSSSEALNFDSSPSTGNFSRFDSNAAQTPLLYTSGLQASIGGGVKKAIGKRSFIVSGLQYSFYRNQVTAAPQLPADSIAGSLYNYMLSASGNTRIVSRFTNTFYFIELPVGLEHQLLKNRLLHLQYGITVSQLLSGKALRFDNNKNVYHQDAAGLRKTGLAIYTTIDYTVWKGRGLALQVGPHLQYGLNKTFRNTSAKSHLVSGGIAVTMGF